MTSPASPRKPSFIITLGLLTAVAALTVDLSLPAIPDMVKALATDLTRGQQIVGIFMAGMALGQIPAGLISDRIGRLPVLYAGMGLFAVGAVASAIAGQIDLLLAARFLQGCGAATAIVLSRAIVRDIASGKEAARLMSLMTMIFTVAPVIAPTIGALLVARWGWRAPFVTIALLGLLILTAIRGNIHETHTPGANEHPVRQLRSSFAEFFSHRQSIFGLLLIIVPPAGFMSIIATAAALTVEIYGYSITAFGFIFATAGLSILTGAFLNRILVERFDSVQVIALGITLLGFASLQLLLIAWLDGAPFAWLWGCVCLFFLTIALNMPNATVLALDPLPRVAGVASSIIGTSQNIFGAFGAMFAAFIYDGTVRNAVITIGIAGMVTVCIFLARPLIAPGPIVHHGDQPGTD